MLCYEYFSTFLNLSIIKLKKKKLLWLDNFFLFKIYKHWFSLYCTISILNFQPENTNKIFLLTYCLFKVVQNGSFYITLYCNGITVSKWFLIFELFGSFSSLVLKTRKNYNCVIICQFWLFLSVAFGLLTSFISVVQVFLTGNDQTIYFDRLF